MASVGSVFVVHRIYNFYLQPITELTTYIMWLALRVGNENKINVNPVL